jgi:hypothetical protein
MSIRLEFTGTFSLGQLHEELLSAIPALRPVPDEITPGTFAEVVTVLGSETDVVLIVPDDADQVAIQSVIAAHKPAPVTPPPAPDPLVPASVAVSTAVAAAMATVAITSPNLTQAQKDSIQSQVQAKVQSVITTHFAE